MAFDGRDWTPAIERNENAPDWVIAISKSPDGTLYAGTLGNWGYLSPYKDGRYIFQTLSEGMDRRWASLSRFDQIVASEDGVLFAALNGVVVYDKETGTRVYRDVQQTTHAFRMGDTYYVAKRDGGMSTIRAGQPAEPCVWQHTPPADCVFIGHLETEEGIILLSESHGFFELTANGPVPFESPADPLIKQGSRQVVSLSDGYIAIAIDELVSFLSTQHVAIRRSRADHRFSLSKT